jgi:hypothetical protein
MAEIQAITRERWRTAGVVSLTAATMALLTPFLVVSVVAVAAGQGIRRRSRDSLIPNIANVSFMWYAGV